MSVNKTSIGWFSPLTGKREKDLVQEVLDSNYLNDGDVTRTFEAKVAELIGVRHCLAVTSGTAAIALTLMAKEIGQGDEVIVPDFTFIATANAVRLAGAQVKLVDIEPKRFSIDIEKVKSCIGPRTRAIVAVDVNGRGADYNSLETIAGERGLSLICDSTEGLGSKWQGRYLGTYGDAGCFSFSANKTITTGQGGMIATDNTQLHHRLLELKDQGRRRQGTGGNDLHPALGFNFKLTNLQAAVGIAQLERLPQRLVRAKQRDEWYRQALQDCPAVELPCLQNEEGEVTQWTDILAADRANLESVLKSANIGYRAFWYPLHTQKPYSADDLAFKNSLIVSEQGLWLPSGFELAKEQVEYIAGAIKSGKNV